MRLDTSHGHVAQQIVRADGMEESNLPAVQASRRGPSQALQKATKNAQSGLEEKVMEPAAHEVAAGL